MTDLSVDSGQLWCGGRRKKPATVNRLLSLRHSDFVIRHSFVIRHF